MGVFFIYILKSSVCLVLFYLFFRLLLSKETFHRFNRMALLGVLFFSLLIPCIEVTTRHQVEVQQAVLSIEQLLLMAELEATPANVGAVQETPTISWVQIVLLVYLAGILFLVCRNIYSLICLFRLVHSGKHEKLEKGVTLVVHNQEIAPFSWMKYIVISQKDLEEIFISKWDLKISKENSSENPIYKLAGRGGNASGYSLDGDNFVVMKGSHIAPDITDGLQTGYLVLRNQLIADGMIVDGTFKEDYTFTSVSAAAVVILGRSANGRTEWTKLDGRTFAQVGH